jgi:hypothetical protein
MAQAQRQEPAQVVRIGTPMVMRSDMPGRAWSLLFEDDGQTGYFYAVEGREPAMEMLDALHIYNAEDELRGTDCRIELVWSKDGQKGGLRINGTLWAAFDFEHEQGRCRSNFPQPAGRWKMAFRPPWTEALIRQFQ